MRSIRANPWIQVVGLVLFIPAIWPLSRVSPEMGGFAAMMALFFGMKGSELSLEEGGLKIGFTRIRFDEIKAHSKLGDARILIDTHKRKTYELKRWHYSSFEWPVIHRHLEKGVVSD